jgi:hypothetical protein
VLPDMWKVTFQIYCTLILVFKVLVKVVLGRGFLQIIRFSHISIILPVIYPYLRLRVAVTSRREQSLGILR